MLQGRIGADRQAVRTLALRTICARLATSVRVSPRAFHSNCTPHRLHSYPAPAPRTALLGMGQRDIASFFGKPAAASLASKPATKPVTKHAAGVNAASGPGKGGDTKREVRTQAASVLAAGEAEVPASGAVAAEQADGAAPSNVLRESNNMPAEVRPVPPLC